MTPSIRQLEAFVLVYKLGSISKAAERMYITQSAVSVLLRQLEVTLDTRLFDRTTRSLQPTAAAHEALVSAERVLQEMARLSRTMKALADKSMGRVTFAITVALAGSVMPCIVRAFMERFPDVEVVVNDASHELLGRMLLDDEVEFSIGGPPELEEAGLQYETLATYLVSAIQVSKGEVDNSPLRWADVLKTKTIGIQKGTGIRDLIDRELMEHNLAFNPSFEVQFLSTALAMTAEGLGTSILPGYFLPAGLHHGLNARPLIEPTISRELIVVTRRDRSLSAAAEAFIALARAELVRARSELKVPQG